MITAEQKAWAKKLEKLLKAMPIGIEIIVGFSSIDVLPAGCYSEHIHHLDMLCEGGNEINNRSIYSMVIDAERVIPNSESI